MDEFKAGSVVQLKSGGPEMTIARFEVIDGIENAVCGGRKGQKMEIRKIPTSMLKLVREPSPPQPLTK